MTRPSLLDCLPEAATHSRFLAELWENARKGGLLPSRVELTPRRLLPILPMVIIFEYRSPEAVIYRLCGTRFCQLFDRDLTGRNLIEQTNDPERRQIRSERWFNMASLPCGVYTASTVIMPNGYEFNCGSLFLPVLPQARSAPLQFLSVCEELPSGDPTPELVEQFKQRIQTNPGDFAYLDIGRGIPR